MRTNIFGDTVFDSPDDSLVDYLDIRGIAPEDMYVEIVTSGAKWGFDIRHYQDGETILASLKVFESEKEIREYLGQYFEPHKIEYVDD